MTTSDKYFKYFVGLWLVEGQLGQGFSLTDVIWGFTQHLHSALRMCMCVGTQLSFSAQSWGFFVFLSNSYRVSSAPKSVRVENRNVCMDRNVYPVYHLVEPAIYFPVNSFELISCLFIFHSWDSIFEDVPRWCALSLNFSFFWRKSSVFHSSWNESIFELDAKYRFQHYCGHFTAWIFPAIWFLSLMKFVGKDVLPLSSCRHLLEGGSLMTTGCIHVKSEPRRMYLNHSSHRWRASQLSVDRSSQNAL